MAHLFSLRLLYQRNPHNSWTHHRLGKAQRQQGCEPSGRKPHEESKKGRSRSQREVLGEAKLASTLFLDC